MEGDRVIKVLELRCGKQVKTIDLDLVIECSYNEFEKNIRNIFKDSIVPDDILKFYLKPEPNLESLIKNVDDLRIAFNVPESTCKIYVAPFMPMDALRTRVLDLDLMFRSIEDKLLQILNLCRGHELPLISTSTSINRESYETESPHIARTGEMSPTEQQEMDTLAMYMSPLGLSLGAAALPQPTPAFAHPNTLPERCFRDVDENRVEVGTAVVSEGYILSPGQKLRWGKYERISENNI